MGPLQSAIAAYKKVRHEQKEKSRLLRKDLDYFMFQSMLNALSDDQHKIGIDIHLTTGQVIKLRKETSQVAPMRDPYMCEVIK